VTPSAPTGELRVVEDVTVAFADLIAAEFDAAMAAAQERSTGAGACEVRRSDDVDDDTFRMALSGGDTARACYQALAAMPIDWEHVECFLGDERCVPPEDPAANQRLVRESLLDRVGNRARFHPIDCHHPENYAAELEARPPLDIIHLGLGPDGHTASLFPASKALAAPAGALVVENDDPSGRNPHPRVTFTFEAIARGRLVVFTVMGASKHDAFARVLAGEDLPATRVRASRVLWLCDEEALGGDREALGGDEEALGG
jgi:6-phosphogluconolactonase